MEILAVHDYSHPSYTLCHTFVSTAILFIFHTRTDTPRLRPPRSAGLVGLKRSHHRSRTASRSRTSVPAVSGRTSISLRRFVRTVLCAVCCVLRAVCYVPVYCVLCAVCCVMCAVCYVLCTVCYVLCAVCYVLCAVCCVPSQRVYIGDAQCRHWVGIGRRYKTPYVSHLTPPTHTILSFPPLRRSSLLQPLLDCATRTVGSCAGGDDLLAYEWIATHGIEDTSCSPYRASDNQCLPEGRTTCRMCYASGVCEPVSNPTRYDTVGVHGL